MRVLRGKPPTDPDSVDWARVTATTDTELVGQAARDPDTAPVDDADFLANARPVSPIRRTSVTLLVDTDVIEGFRAAGDGLEQRINDALRSYAREQGWLAQARR